MNDLAYVVRQARKDADREAGEAAVIGRQGKAARVEVARLRESLETHELVLATLTRVGEVSQEFVHRQLEGLVTRALQSVFDENLSFHLVPSVKGNQATVDFMLRSRYGGIEVDTPVLDARGGGMAATVGFCLRLVVLLLTPGARRILFLDESFGMLSQEFEPRLAEFLRQVADKAGVQIVLITHSTAYSDLADTSYELSMGADGATRVAQGGSA